MNPAVLLLITAAAAMHAGWNALLRSGADRLWSITVMSFSTSAVALVLVVLRPLPLVQSWPFLAASAVLEVGYAIFLAQAYRRGELGQVYPVARGSAPLLATLGAALLVGEEVDARSIIAILLISVGILCLMLGRRRLRALPLVLALITGAFIAAYTLVDAVGARLAGDPLAYVAWMFLLYGLLLPGCVVILRGPLRVDFWATETRKALLGGVLSLLTYGLVIVALTLGQIGPVSALRETSVVFAALLGRAVLGEAMTPLRLASCGLIALGAAALAWHG